jgi:hypothetical protein
MNGEAAEVARDPAAIHSFRGEQAAPRAAEAIQDKIALVRACRQDSLN